MILALTLRPDHMEAGRIRSTNEDPLALAIKEKLGDYESPRDFVAVGDIEVYLSYHGKDYIAYYDVPSLYRTTSDKSRLIKLDFIFVRENNRYPTKRVSG